MTRFRNVNVFAFARWGSDRAFRRWGERWGITSVPLPVLLLSAALFVMTPVTNAIIRVQESEADHFGLNAEREPDGFTEVSPKLSAYRKMEPGPLEERIFLRPPERARPDPDGDAVEGGAGEVKLLGATPRPPARVSCSPSRISSRATCALPGLPGGQPQGNHSRPETK